MAGIYINGIPEKNIPDAGWLYYCFSWWPATLYGAWSSPKVARRCCLDTRDLNGCATMFSMIFSCIQFSLYFTPTYIYIYIHVIYKPYFLPEVPPTLSSLVLWPRCGRRHFGWRTMAWRVLNEQSSGRTQKSWWLRWTGVVLPYIYIFYL